MQKIVLDRQLPVLKGPIPELDGIRGYACLSVLVVHCLLGIMQPELGSFVQPAQKHLMMLLVGGLDCFFVLSGFLICGMLMESRGKPHYFKKFWIRRIARIFPVLYILLFTYAIALFIKARYNPPELDLWLLAPPIPPFWTYATFTQSFPIAEGGFGGPRWVGITWSLAIESQFYLFFPFVVYFLSRRWILTLLAVIGIVVALYMRVYLEQVYNGNWYAPYVLLPARMDSLMFGILLAIVVRNPLAFNIAYKLRWFFDLIILSVLYIFIMDVRFHDLWFLPFTSNSPIPLINHTLFGVLFGLVMLRVFLYPDGIVNRIWRTKWLCEIGLISYSLYMYHQSLNGLVHGFMFGQEPKIFTPLQVVLAFIIMGVATVLARLSYDYIETPIRKFGHRYANRFN